MKTFLLVAMATTLHVGTAVADSPSPFAGARPVAEERLKAISGRENLNQTVVARNSSNVSNNSVGDHTQTGQISFDGQSFQGLRGLSVLSANTGNNVSINASMNVNVAIRQ